LTEFTATGTIACCTLAESNEDAFYEAVNTESPLIQDEEALPDDTMPPEAVEVVAEIHEEEEEDRFVLISDADIDKLKVADLKDELGKRGLSKNGKKGELCSRLMHRVPIRPVVAGVTRNNAGQQIAGFSVTAKWKVL
jgi:SAP domain